MEYLLKGSQEYYWFEIHGMTGVGPLSRYKKYLLKQPSGMREGRVRANQIFNEME
jgi:hypothetical protein